MTVLRQTAGPAGTLGSSVPRGEVVLSGLPGTGRQAEYTTRLGYYTWGCEE